MYIYVLIMTLLNADMNANLAAFNPKALFVYVWKLLIQWRLCDKSGVLSLNYCVRFSPPLFNCPKQNCIYRRERKFFITSLKWTKMSRRKFKVHLYIYKSRIQDEKVPNRHVKRSVQYKKTTKQFSSHFRGCHSRQCMCAILNNFGGPFTDRLR